MSGLVYLRARFYHPVLGRFLQWDSFAGFQQRPQSLNRYSYTENNPVNHRDPSGHFIDTLLDVGFLAYDVYRLVQDNVLHNCDNLNENVFALMLDVGGLLLPGLTGLGHADEVYDLVRYADELPEAGRFADDAAKLLDNGDDVGKLADDVEKNLDCLFNSFSADTPVMTAAGEVPISEIQVGDLVLAYDEATGATGYYTVTAVISHVDPSLIELTIDGETLETTAEHPFYVMASAPWLATGASQGRWVDAGDLHVGDAVRQADGTTGIVQAVVVVQRSQPMYNLTVAVAHTFFVGEQQWLVHNCGGSRGRLPGPTIDERTGEEVGRFIVDPNGNTMIEPVGGKTVAAGRGGVDTHTLYPNDSNYQRLNPLGHPNNPTPHAHGHLPGTGPGMRGQGPSLDPYGNVVPWASAGAHWPIN